MTDKYLTVEFTANATPAEAFAAINNPRGWWSEDITGNTTAVGDEFTYVYGDIHRSIQRVAELVPDARVVWHVVEGYLNFTENPAEWAGTDIVFDITPDDNNTRVRLTHVGLTPDIECFEACSKGWGYYAGEKLPEMIAASRVHA